MEHTNVTLHLRVTISHETEAQFWERLEDVKRAIRLNIAHGWYAIKDATTYDIPKLPNKD